MPLDLYFTCYLQAERGDYPGIQVAARLSYRVLWTLAEKTHSGRDARPGLAVHGVFIETFSAPGGTSKSR